MRPIHTVTTLLGSANLDLRQGLNSLPAGGLAAAATAQARAVFDAVHAAQVSLCHFLQHLLAHEQRILLLLALLVDHLELREAPRRTRLVLDLQARPSQSATTLRDPIVQPRTSS